MIQYFDEFYFPLGHQAGGIEFMHLFQEMFDRKMNANPKLFCPESIFGLLFPPPSPEGSKTAKQLHALP